MRLACDAFGMECNESLQINKARLEEPSSPWIFVRWEGQDYYFCSLDHLQQWAYCNKSGDNCK